MDRESMQFDVLIVGAGPAGLAAAIRLRQLALKDGRELSVAVLEKGSEVGAHILSGAVIDPVALDELIPKWGERGAPLSVPVSENRHLFLGEKGSFALPHALLPPMMSNKGCYVASLGNLCRWLAKEAEALGVEIYPGFAAADVLYKENGAVEGIVTADMGRDRNGHEKPSFEPGMALKAAYTLFAEGARGSLTKRLIARFDLREGIAPQTYGLGIKELWEVAPEKHKAGRVLHTQGWPLDSRTAGGGFLYHMAENQVSLGFVTALDYENPYLSPFCEFQRWKLHPAIRPLLEGGRRIAYGARAINEGGFQSIPKLVFPGGALVGCAAGFVNVPRIKGSHNAMKSGMLAADAVFSAIAAGRSGDELPDYPESLKRSFVWRELKAVRNIRPALNWGLLPGTLYGGLDMWLHALGLGSLIPWTLKPRADHLSLKKAADCQPIPYPRPDGVITFDRLSSVFLSNTNHEEDQPSHLHIKDPSIPVAVNLARYGGPEARYCPAAVYEFLDDGPGGVSRLQVNAQNCVHCKTCDIKDPMQNIDWAVPEGGGGPNYPNM